MSMSLLEFRNELISLVEKKGLYWQLLVINENELFFSLDQLPRTYEWAKW
jgi:hypothetical protein